MQWKSEFKTETVKLLQRTRALVKYRSQKVL